MSEVKNKIDAFHNEKIALTNEEEAVKVIAEIGDKIELVKKLGKEAEEAEKASKEAMRVAEEAKRKAEETKKKFEEDKKKPGLLFGKKEAIEKTQNSVGDIADAQQELSKSQISLAEAISASSKAQKVSFECQEKLAELSKAMISLGVGSLAKNRIIVREVEKRLQGASEEEIGELARNELYSVLIQLKEQEDLIIKHEQLKGIVREHDQKIIEQDKADEEQDVELKRQAEVDEKHNELLQQHTKEIREFNETITKLQDELNRKGSNTLLLVTSISSFVALVLSIVHFFI